MKLNKFLLLLILLVNFAYADKEAHHIEQSEHILVLHSDNQSMSWVKNINGAIENTLQPSDNSAESSIILNKIISFYEKNETIHKIGLFLITVLVLVIVMLFVNIKKIRKAKNELQKLKNSLEALVEQRTSELEEQNKKLLKAQHISSMGFWELDLENNKLYWSDEIFNIFEIDSNMFEASYDGFLNVIHPDDRDAVNEAYSNSLQTKEDYFIEHRLLMKDGRIKWVKEECSTEFDDNGKPLISVGVVIDITTLHITQQKLLEQTYIDDLTKLNNRKSYNEKIKQLLSQHNRYKTPFSIIMYDIDDFKQINDTYGHSIGDDVLMDMSRLIKSHIRDTDYIFRVGGEEFVILLTETKIDKAKVVSEKIRNSVENDLKTVKDKKITISIGLSEVREDDNEDVIYIRVDELLYKAKNSGKNKVSY